MLLHVAKGLCRFKGRILKWGDYLGLFGQAHVITRVLREEGVGESQRQRYDSGSSSQRDAAVSQGMAVPPEAGEGKEWIFP